LDIPRPGKHPHADFMGLLLLAMSSFGLFILILSGILVVNLLTALMASQIRQIGVMKALGGTRGKIARIYFGQALLLGIAAIAIAIPTPNNAAMTSARCDIATAVTSESRPASLTRGSSRCSQPVPAALVSASIARSIASSRPFTVRSANPPRGRTFPLTASPCRRRFPRAA